MNINDKHPLFDNRTANNGLPRGLATFAPASTLSANPEGRAATLGAVKTRVEADLWNAIAQAEQHSSQDQLVQALANSHLGYLVYEFLGKTLDSRPVLQERTQHTLPSDNDVFLASLVKQIQAQRGITPTE